MLKTLHVTFLVRMVTYLALEAKAYRYFKKEAKQ